MDKILMDSFGELGVDIDSLQVSKFMKYKDMLLLWNEKMNLTAITDEREVILKHFADSVSLVPFIDFENKKVIDVGSGAGFPGIPIKIVKPSISLTLLDSLNKRINFLFNVVSEIELSDVECIHLRAEDGGRMEGLRENFDICVSRAVANLAVLSEYCLPFVKNGGYFVSLKGPDAGEEILNAEKAVEILGGVIEEVKTVDIPFTDITHTLIMIKKVRQTPFKYPRKSGKISKNPIN